MNQDMMSCVIAGFVFITIYTVRQGQKDTSLTKNVRFELRQSFLTLGKQTMNFHKFRA